jgi:hypothetical protein
MSKRHTAARSLGALATGLAVAAAAMIATAVSPVSAQSRDARTGTQLEDSLKAHQADFDYLLGDWEFTLENRNGKLHGVWSAAKLPETGQIIDEFRVLGDSGRTLFVSTSLRAYSATLDRWELVSVDDGGTGLRNFGTAHRDGNEMRVEQTFGLGTGKSWISRIRYYDIRADHFSWISDRSEDGGKTWIMKYQRIEARRTGPARTLTPLTRAIDSRRTRVRNIPAR